MHIGILTFHSVDNYGAVLQAFALQTYLSSLGHEVEIIDYRPSYFHGARKWPLNHPGRIVANFASLYQNRKFEQFRRSHLNRSAVCRTSHDLGTKLPSYDAIVVGSDQVWSPDVDRRNTTDEVYFCQFKLPAATRKIAYAASFGTKDIQSREEAAIARGLGNMDVISVREPTGQEIVNRLSQKRATWTCDPVFLLSRNQWRVCAKSHGGFHPRRNAILSYMLPFNREWGECLKRENTELINIGWNPCCALSRNQTCRIPSPLAFVQMIASARGLVTKSFHGIAFAIVLNVPFVYMLPTRGGEDRATRVTSLLDRLGLSDRVLCGGDDMKSIMDRLAMQIDWDAVQCRLRGFRAESVSFLDNALSAR